MELNKEIEKALVKINFVEKYENISNYALIKYKETETKINKVEPPKILGLLETVGMPAKYIKKEKFYKTEDISTGKYSFRMHFAFNFDFVECIWVVYEGNDLLLGSPLGVLPRLLISSDFRIKPPKYSSYDDILTIAKQLQSLFKEFQKALIESPN